MKLIKLNNQYLLVDNDSTRILVGHTVLRVKTNEVAVVTDKVKEGYYWGRTEKEEDFDFTNGQALKVLGSTGMIDGMNNDFAMLYISQIENLLGVGEGIDLQTIIDKRNTTERYDSNRKIYNYSEQDIKDILNEYESIKPNIKVDVLKMADEDAKSKNWNGSRWEDYVDMNHRRGFVRGYYRAIQDDSEMRFTIKDIEKAYNKGFHSDDCKLFQDYKKTLKKEKSEWNVEIETELEPIPESLAEYPMSYTQKSIPKITNGYINITKIN